ncbi:Excinuclease ABC, C subunit [Prunus dulcis]|uniref:Excinuclease ABC, C subunit n=1 Tax=Prunus dulcis TaxID=3755 RepID=A0A4Y1QXB3_PRUDU|nr:Excinuclease ABC, C subunit [Prunus dulcis]
MVCTYVGVTTDFSRRLKQHNGELKGGAKASCAGRPWICACLIHGFKDQSEACEFESKWKSLSRSLPRKRKNDNKVEQVKDLSLPLLQHRQAALNRVKGLLDCTHLEIDWKLGPFHCQIKFWNTFILTPKANSKANSKKSIDVHAISELRQWSYEVRDGRAVYGSCYIRFQSRTHSINSL